MNLNPSPPRLASRLYDPSILRPIEPILEMSHSFFKFSKQNGNSFFGILRRNVFQQFILFHQFQVPRGACEILVTLGVHNEIIDVITYHVELVVLARDEDLLIWIKNSIAHQSDSTFHEAD